MTGEMDKYWIIPRGGDKELSSTGLLQSPHFLCSYEEKKAVIRELKVSPLEYGKS